MSVSPLLRLATLAAALVACDGAPPSIAVPPPLRAADCRLALRLTHRGVPAQIGVAGTFNDFDADAHPLTRIEGDRWGVDVALPPGEHRYRVEIDGRPFLDPANPLSVADDGAEWSLRHVPDCSQPAFALTARTYDDGGPVYGLTLRRVDAADGLDAATVRAWVDDTPTPVQVEGDTVRFDARGLAAGKYRFRIEAADAAGRPTAAFDAPFWAEPAPFRWRDALIYQVFTDRFSGDHDFTPGERLTPIGERAGGNLAGIRRKLREGYFERLGVNVLWISPMNLNPDGLWTGVEGGPPRYESYHAYWPSAPRSPDPRFGDEAAIEGLLAEAHARGVRVLLDVVLNHVHAEHPYYTEHPEWFGEPGCYCGRPDCSWGAHIEDCWFMPYLPDVAWTHHEALTAQVDDALWWIERFGFDGLRVDAVPMMPRFVTRALTAQLHARFEGLGNRHYLVGETFTGPAEQARIRWYLGPDGLDGQFDFPLMWALRQVFAFESDPVWHLADAWAASEAAWAGSTAVMGVFVGNHDVARFTSEANGDVDSAIADQPWSAPPSIPTERRPYEKTLLAQAFVLTAPGAATLYQGDEFGQPGSNDPDNRRPMRFGGDRTPDERWLFERTARLGRLRACLPSLRAGTLYPLRAEAERMAYLRDADDGAPAVVVLARDPEAPRVALELPPGVRLDATTLVDVMSGRRVAVDGSQLEPFDLPAYTPAVLIPAGHPCAQASGADR